MFRKIEILYLKRHSGEKFIAPKYYYLKMSLSDRYPRIQREKPQFQKPEKQTVR